MRYDATRVSGRRSQRETELQGMSRPVSPSDASSPTDESAADQASDRVCGTPIVRGRRCGARARDQSTRRGLKKRARKAIVNGGVQAWPAPSDDLIIGIMRQVSCREIGPSPLPMHCPRHRPSPKARGIASALRDKHVSDDAAPDDRIRHQQVPRRPSPLAPMARKLPPGRRLSTKGQQQGPRFGVFGSVLRKVPVVPLSGS